MELKVKKLTPEAKLPTKTHETDAGIDVYALETYCINPGETCKIRTGIAIQPDLNLPLKHVGVSCIWDRSGLGSKGIHRLAGVIDVDYTAEILVCLTNLNFTQLLLDIADGDLAGVRKKLNNYEYAYEVVQGDKIAQLLIQTVCNVKIVEVEELNDTDRGQKGFGSSGR